MFFTFTYLAVYLLLHLHILFLSITIFFSFSKIFFFQKILQTYANYSLDRKHNIFLMLLNLSIVYLI